MRTIDDSSPAGPGETGMVISEKTSRILYVAELIVFALLPVLALTAWTIFAGLPALFTFIWSIPMLAASMLFDISQTPGEMLQAMALSGMIAGLAAMGAAALVKFSSLSAAFVKGGRAELMVRRRAFWQCLGWASLPLLATNTFMPGMSTEIFDERAFRFLSYGLTLGVPLFHLWAEMEYRQA